MSETTERLIILGIRGALILLFFYNASLKAVVYFLLLIGSVYVLPNFFHLKKSSKAKKTRDILHELYPTISEEEQKKQLMDGILTIMSYDAENTPCLNNFEVVKRNSNCVFARKARLWGSCEWDKRLTLEGNIYRMLGMFVKFTVVCPSEKLDGFLVELPGDMYGHSIQAFGTGLYKVLKLISDFDPAGLHCMNKSYVGKRGWVFEFNKLTFFITTFAPFYPSMHPRYSFGADSCYILFQPELSFAFHDLPPDTTETKWEGPESVRDKIRVAFKEAGRPYSVPESVSSPMALEMLRPISEEEEVFEWWKQQDL